MTENIVHEPFLITDLRQGIGNILIEMLVGLFLANHLTKISGKTYRYYALLTKQIMHGHQTFYTEAHHTMPHPLKLAEIFPNITFITQVPTNTLHINLSQLSDITTLANNLRIYIIVDQLDVTMLNQLNSAREILPALSYNNSIISYVQHKFNMTNSLGIHIRLWQIGDYLHGKYPTVAWYRIAVNHIIKQKDMPKRIYVISGLSSSLAKSLATFNELILMLRSNYPTSEIIIVDKEPYYVDLVLLNLCNNLIITNTTFSLTSALLTLNENRLVVYPDLIEVNRHQPITLPGFQLLPTENYIQY